MIDCPKHSNGNQALLECKDHISQLSYTSFRAHTGYLGHYVWQYGELRPNDTPEYELACLFQRKYLKFSNPQLTSNKVVKAI